MSRDGYRAISDWLLYFRSGVPFVSDRVNYSREGGIMRDSGQRGSRRKLSMTILMSLAAVALVTAACGSSTSSSSKKTSKVATSKTSYVVGFTNPTEAQPVLDVIGQAMIARGKRLGVKVIELDDQLSITKQVSDIETLTAEHVNGIVVFPLDAQADVPALDAARKAGIKVVAISGETGSSTGVYPPISSPYQADVTQGGVPDGKMEGRAFAADMHDKGNYVEIGLSTPVPGVIFQLSMEQYFAQKAAPQLHLLGEVYNSTDNEAGGEKAMQQAIGRWGNKIDGVLAYNDLSAIGAAIALKQAGMSHVVIFGRNGGLNGRRAIESGEIQGMEDIFPWQQGATAMNVMYRLLKGEPVVPNVVQVPGALYTKANISNQLLWSKAVSEIASGKLVGLDPPTT